MNMKRLMVIATLALMGCTSPKHAASLLSDQGYTNIETGGYGWFSCSKDDEFATRFKATSPAGKVVKGTVCAGWFKGSTIRFD